MTAATEQAERPPAAQPGAWLRRGLDRMFGYDFFISYAHADAQDYAWQLDEALRTRGFRPFLDSQVYVAGDDLNDATLRRVKASSKLIAVVGRRALESHWVYQEVEAAIGANRPVIAIDLLGDLSDRASDNRLAALLRDRIHIRERPGHDGAPTGQTLDALARSFQATRREALRLRLALLAMAFFALLAGFSYWQKTLADARADQYARFCGDVVGMVIAGNQKIEDLRYSEFGNLIADITDTLAQLPDPANDPGWDCIPAGI